MRHSTTDHFKMHWFAYGTTRFHRTIRVEFAVPAATRREARTIAERERRVLKGYHFMGGN